MTRVLQTAGISSVESVTGELLSSVVEEIKENFICQLREPKKEI